ncbi:MAG: hypothetical protein M3299_06325 [Thermoproteota archaeon]|nr:hypothetical protein [Thermoproteota archaeon]
MAGSFTAEDWDYGVGGSDSKLMGRTIPSFRTVLAMEKEEWKPFRNALSKSDRKNFDQMWDIPRLYASACSNSCQLVPLHPIIMSILFHHYTKSCEGSGKFITLFILLKT